jgi:alpha-beta hydrolase superfamily lysophospholipase
MSTSIEHGEGRVTQRVVPGPALYFRSAMPARDGAQIPRARVGILHGYADHAGRFAHVMDAWAAHGIGSVALDLRGHGRADGPRGHCARFEEYTDDVAELARLVADRARGAPAFLFAHSFGALVAAASVEASPGAWRGVVLSAPYLALALPVPPAKGLAARLTSRVLPRLALATGMRGADLTRDPARARAYDEDPLVFPTATVRWFTEATKAQARVLSSAPRITSPLYVLAGTDDRVARMETARALHDGAASADKTWDQREGFFHEVLNDPGWPAIADDIARWILARAEPR